MDMFSEIKSKGSAYHIDIIKEYYNHFKAIESDPYERRALDYVDVLSWLESKIQNKSLQSLIKEKKAAQYQKG